MRQTFKTDVCLISTSKLYNNLPLQTRKSGQLASSEDGRLNPTQKLIVDCLIFSTLCLWISTSMKILTENIVSYSWDQRLKWIQFVSFRTQNLLQPSETSWITIFIIAIKKLWSISFIRTWSFNSQTKSQMKINPERFCFLHLCTLEYQQIWKL